LLNNIHFKSLKNNTFRNIIVFIAVSPIHFYRFCISPFTPSSCRHVPTCSQYAIEAVKLYGFKGFWIAAKRISKCHPWGTSGYDPVPKPGYPRIKFKKIDLE